MARSIKISWATSHYTYGEDDGVRVRFTATCASGVSSKIFAYRMLPKNRTGGEVGMFSHICSPVDLEDFPEDGPNPGASPGWFRLAFVDVMVRSVTEAANFIEVVREDVRRIIATLNTMDTLFHTGTELLGPDCESSSSASDSLSSSSSSAASLGSLSLLSAVGTYEQSVGAGVAWTEIGTGAGSPVGSSDSDGLNRSRVIMLTGEASQLLLVQGFDLSELSDDAIIEGITARLVLRDLSDGSIAASSSSSASSVAADCPRLSFVTLQHPVFGLGTNMADSDCILGPDWDTITYGGPANLWGFAAVTGKDLKDGAFGLGLVVNNTFRTTSSIVDIDGVEIDVYFREEV